MAKNTIQIKNYSNVFLEKTAAGAITPGMLIEFDSNGKVQAHNSAGENALKMFALEDELQGNGISDAYAADDQVNCWIPGRGDIVNALLSNGEDVSIGDFLESDGAGRLQKHNPSSEVSEYPEGVVGIALEAVDMSGSSGEDPSGRIQVLIV